MKTDEFLNFSSEFADFSVDGVVTKGSDASGCEIAAVVRPGRKRVMARYEKGLSSFLKVVLLAAGKTFVSHIV